jgi:hypothetical protein
MVAGQPEAREEGETTMPGAGTPATEGAVDVLELAPAQGSVKPIAPRPM